MDNCTVKESLSFSGLLRLSSPCLTARERRSTFYSNCLLLNHFHEYITIIHSTFGIAIGEAVLILCLTNSDGAYIDFFAFFGELVLTTVIPRSVRLSEAPGNGRSGLAYDPKSPGAVAYRAAAAELRSTTIDLTQTTQAVQA